MKATDTLSNRDAEAALIGALLIDNSLLHSLPPLPAGAFTLGVHQRLYDALAKGVTQGRVVTPITLKPIFDFDPELEEIGGFEYVVGLTAQSAVILGARDFAAQIGDLSVMRRIEAMLADGREKALAFDPDVSPAQVASDLAAGLLQAVEGRNPVRIRSAAQAIGRVRDRIDEVAAGGSTGATCRTIPDLNDIIGPAAAGTLTVIGGRPSMGKSVLWQSAAWGYAINGHPTLGISQEMGEDALYMRLAADLTHAMGEPVPYKSIQSGKGLSHSNLKTLEEAEARVSTLPLSLVSPGRATIEEIEGIVARHVGMLARQGQRLEVLGIDYAQIVGTTRRMEERDRVNYISERVLHMAKRYGLAAFLLSQLNRDVESRTDHKPMMSDLKQSGRLEEDADNVILVYRPEYYLERSRLEPAEKGYQDWFESWQLSRGKVHLIGAKVRHGETGTHKAQFFGASQAIRGSDYREPFLGEQTGLL